MSAESEVIHTLSRMPAGSSDPAAPRRDMTVVGMSWMEAVLITAKVTISRLGLPSGSWLSLRIAFIALMPGGVAAFALIMCGAMLLFGMTGFGSGSADEHQKKLTVTIPENLDFSTAFDDLFEKYTLSHKLVNVKTTNMGSLFKLSYDVELKSDASEKGFIDELRCRNGNLEISLHRQESNPNEL